MTLDHVEVLDPVGKAMRIDASKLTVVKTGGFGLGKSKPEELAMVTRKLAQTEKKVEKWEK